MILELEGGGGGGRGERIVEEGTRYPLEAGRCLIKRITKGSDGFCSSGGGDRTGPPYKLGEAASFEDSRETWPSLPR